MFLLSLRTVYGRDGDLVFLRGKAGRRERWPRASRSKPREFLTATASCRSYATPGSTRPVDEVSIEVPCGDAEEAADKLLAIAEDAIMSIGAPFVPIRHEGTIYIRPPLS